MQSPPPPPYPSGEAYLGLARAWIECDDGRALGRIWYTAGGDKDDGYHESRSWLTRQYTRGPGGVPKRCWRQLANVGGVKRNLSAHSVGGSNIAALKASMRENRLRDTSYVEGYQQGNGNKQLSAGAEEYGRNERVKAKNQARARARNKLALAPRRKYPHKAEILSIKLIHGGNVTGGGVASPPAIALPHWPQHSRPTPLPYSREIIRCTLTVWRGVELLYGNANASSSGRA